jgi:hypothetical protein
MTKRCCGTCVYAMRPKGHWIRIILSRWPGLLFCCNRADAPGDMQEVYAHGTCRNHHPLPEPTGRHADKGTRDSGIRRIPLTKGKFATVDAADYEWLSRYKWSAVARHGNWYACRREGKRTIWMHREIMQAPRSLVVDHFDRNGLNNRRCNLRLCDRRQNAYNVRHPSPESQYVGVLRYGLLWGASITHDGVEHSLGLFDTEIEAALARDERARELQGDYAYLNFPHGPPPGFRAPRRASHRVPLSGVTIARSRAIARLSRQARHRK